MEFLISVILGLAIYAFGMYIAILISLNDDYRKLLSRTDLDLPKTGTEDKPAQTKIDILV
jgi:hypothetical protein